MNFNNPYNDDEKKENGVYYTPQDVSIVIAERAKIVDDGKGIWLDPCCGLGILSITMASIQDDPIDFITNRLIINEIDKNQLQIALSNFKEKFGVVPRSFNENFLEYNFDEDFIIMNPPYFKYEDSDIYAHFIEKACRTTNGFVSINPVSFTNGKNFQRTRNMILQFSSITLYHFDNIPGQIFKDAKVRVSIIVTHNKNSERKTTGQIRWKSEHRKEMLCNLDDNLSEGVFTDNIFYKTLPNTKQYISAEKKLKDFVVENSEYPIFVTNSPRYFITASTEILDRKGQIKIYMKDLDSYYKAIVLLNSSYLYWWWRTSDSSLSLTKKTLLSLPWVDVNYDIKIINKILESQLNNKVYKKNAGKLQENIKHPKELLKELNSLFLTENFIDFHN
jgi:type I restriction-modification system DNA methylase subunit